MSERAWQKSSFSSPNGDTNCVELALTGERLLLRESERPDLILSAGPAAYRALLDGIKAGRLPATTD
ncbi:DUF397 domain-containing protein [Streptomyces aidingensis]|uniref:DUF397 domain-containing protein n=1 Tax=Streptomyces aidingensis TaxID=910347 RepID=A0A1I1TDS5_9ACTN|nr:DUF397 domain-containing protein [Streptomyces aidingensis]SFD56729.1 protein of unknown function [Streptomyces aidingensis]